MSKKYIVTLTDEERRILEQLTKKGKSPVYKVNQARILLLADTRNEDGAWTDQAISKALNISIPTIERVRRRLVEQGIEVALSRQTTKTRKLHKLDGEQEAHLIAMACSQAPVGFARWTLRLLAKRMVELEIVESLSHETVRQTLKKTNLNPGSRNHGLFHLKRQPNLSTTWKM
jgi:transposase